MGPGVARDASRACGVASLIAFVDTNVLIRHLTGDPPAQARRATAVLAEADQLLVTDVVFAECVFVLESFYEVPRPQLATTMRALLAMSTVTVADQPVLLRALEVYMSRIGCTLPRRSSLRWRKPVGSVACSRSTRG